MNAYTEQPGPRSRRLKPFELEAFAEILTTSSRIRHAVRVLTNVTKPIPARGWYLNIHQGNSANIQNSHGMPTIHFRPLLCANINGGH